MDNKFRCFQKVPVAELDPEARKNNFQEVCLGYTKEEAIKEAHRCLQCKVPRCRKGCPAFIDIPKFIYGIANENFKEAIESLWEGTSLPAICGQVCPQEKQREKYCVLTNRGDSVFIGKLERFAVDYARDRSWRLEGKEPANGHKVAIVGGGPRGLTCVGELVKEGFEVHVFEALQKLGEVLIYRIPSFRLPGDVVEAKVENLKALGVHFETNAIIGRTVTIDQLREEGFEAFFVSSDAGLPKFLSIPGENLNGVFSASEFLTRANLIRANDQNCDTPTKLGKEASVIDGGSVAMDAARVAKRLGSDVTIIYRRGQDSLPVRAEEAHHAIKEGIHPVYLTSPKEILGNDQGWVEAMKCIKMELGQPDASGHRRPSPIEGSEFILETDSVIMALGTSPNPLIAMTTEDLETENWGDIVVEEMGQTSREEVFVGGDTVTGAAAVILAMSSGKIGAQDIKNYLPKE